LEVNKIDRKNYQYYMDTTYFLKTIKKRQGIIITFVLIFIGLALIATFSQPLKYRASSRLLIIQEGTTSDSYAIAKSNQYLSSLLSEAVSSGSFFDLMTGSNSGVDWSYFGGDYKQQIKKWKKTVTAQSANDTGVMAIETYHPNSEQAKQIAIAVNNIIMSQNNIYQGSDTNVKIKVIDQPLVSSFPVKPNLILNFAAGLIFGLLFGLAYVYYFPESKKEKRQAMIKNIRQERIREQIGEREEGGERPSFRGDINNIIN